MDEIIERLIGVLSRLPGLGRRSAERIAMRLVRDRSHGLARDLVAALQDLDACIRLCSVCGNVTPLERDPCRICTDPRRDAHLLCVVGQPADIVQLERSGSFRGRYHALLGKVSPMHGEGPKQVRVEGLLDRVRRDGVREVILALDTDVESDATAHFLREHLAALGVRVSRLAYGLPAGSGIAYSDPLTLSRALEGRRPVD